jgi:hypothetical protein
MFRTSNDVSKVSAYGDMVIAKQILITPDQNNVKALGIKVKNFNPVLCNTHKMERKKIFLVLL